MCPKNACCKPAMCTCSEVVRGSDGRRMAKKSVLISQVVSVVGWWQAVKQQNVSFCKKVFLKSYFYQVCSTFLVFNHLSIVDHRGSNQLELLKTLQLHKTALGPRKTLRPAPGASDLNIRGKNKGPCSKSVSKCPAAG